MVPRLGITLKSSDSMETLKQPMMVVEEGLQEIRIRMKTYTIWMSLHYSGRLHQMAP